MSFDSKEKIAGQDPRYYRIAAGLLILYFFLLIFNLGLYDFYQDEARYWWEIRRNFPDLIRWFKRDIHPPLYGIILKLWAALWGRGATSLRALSIICALGAFMVLIKLLGKFLSFPHAVLSLGIYALLPYGIFCFRLVKYYSLMNLLVLISSYYFLILLTETKSRISKITAYIFFSSLILYTQYLGILALVTQGMIYIIFRGWRNYFKRLFRYHGMILLIFLPWIFVFASHAISVAGVPPVTHRVFSLKEILLRVLYIFYAFLFGNSLEPRHVLLTAVGAMILLLTFFGSWKNVLRSKGGVSFPVLLFFWIGIILGMLASFYFFYFVHFLFLPERYAYLLPFFAIVLAGGILSLRRLGILLVPPLFLLFGFSLYNFHTNSEGTVWAYRMDWGKIKETVKTSGVDYILFDNYHFGTLGIYHFGEEYHVIPVWDEEKAGPEEQALINLPENKPFWFIRSTNDVSVGQQIEQMEARLEERFGKEERKFFVEDHPGLYRIKQRLTGERLPQTYKVAMILYRNKKGKP